MASGKLKIGLALAAAFGLVYGGYAIRGNSVDLPQSKTVEETVCEEIDTNAIWEAGRKFGDLEGLKAGIREGKVIGERETKDKWFEKGRIYGESLGLAAYDERKYNEGLNTCDDTKYQDGMIEGEKLGLREGRQKFYGSGTSFRSEEGNYHFTTNRQNIEGEWVTLNVEINEQKCISRYILINNRTNPTFLEDECINNEDTDGLVDNIKRFGPTLNSSRWYDEISLQRDRDFYANQNYPWNTSHISPCPFPCIHPAY